METILPEKKYYYDYTNQNYEYDSLLKNPMEMLQYLYNDHKKQIYLKIIKWLMELN